MKDVKEKDIIKVHVTGIQQYGIFVETDEDYDGLIHISEVSYGYVKNVNDYLKVGDNIYAEIIDIDKNNHHLKLSIKDVDYKKNGERLKRMAETKDGFEPLKNNLDNWIDTKIKELMDKM